MTNELDNCYLACMLDGEGSIGLMGIHEAPYLCITQKDFSFLTQLAQEYPGGSIYVTRNGRNGANGAWMLRWHKASIVKEILVKAIPHLRIKKQEAIVLTSLCDSVRSVGTNKRSEVDELCRLKLQVMFKEAVKARKERVEQEWSDYNQQSKETKG